MCACVYVYCTCLMEEAQMVLVRWSSMDEGSKLCTLVVVFTWPPLLAVLSHCVCLISSSSSFNGLACVDWCDCPFCLFYGRPSEKEGKEETLGGWMRLGGVRKRWMGRIKWQDGVGKELGGILCCLYNICTYRRIVNLMHQILCFTLL